MLVLLYCMFVMSRRNAVLSRSVLAIPSILSVAMSTISAFGFAALFFDFTLAVRASIMLLLAIGVDE